MTKYSRDSSLLPGSLLWPLSFPHLFPNYSPSEALKPESDYVAPFLKALQ